ncbi:TlpA disulfide reductase family protein [Seonamhaeicola sp. ML3]|uniref:TlpA family protein disulfide reductase n=1 Tax=Seonamhaeicola sp. ML3 TaxID=2937786 RepID=UPI00200C6B60|nr:TlpA disulfide reductase family protein [Seonamhaeicola sp. ML3]
MKLKKPKFRDVLFLIVVALLIIPQTRKPIQVFLNKGLALISPSVLSEENQGHIAGYSWSLVQENGENFNFETLKGKVILVNFWATWCPPCIAEMSSLQELYDDYNQKIEFVFVTDDSFKTVNQFLKKNDYNLPIYRSVSNFNKIFELKSIPRTFLVDKNGKIIIDKTGAANWNSETVREIIDKLILTKS